jgi:hypothetical protein
MQILVFRCSICDISSDSINISKKVCEQMKQYCMWKVFTFAYTVTETQDISVTELTFGVIMASTNVFYVFAVCRKFVLT